MNARTLRTTATLAAVVALLSGCVSVKKDYTKLVAARPRSILFVPVVNNTAEISAAEYFLSTVPIPLAERGYYVFPVNLVKRVLEDDGLADASLVHSAEASRLAALFGADSVLYVSIERWDAKYMVIATKVTVSLKYLLKDAKTGETLWEDAETMVYNSNQNNQGGLISAVVNAALTKAAPNYMPLARQANGMAFRYPGPGFPSGPYHPQYMNDWSPPVTAAQAQPPPATP